MTDTLNDTDARLDSINELLKVLLRTFGHTEFTVDEGKIV